jgi:hypothetical protein
MKKTMTWVLVSAGLALAACQDRGVDGRYGEQGPGTGGAGTEAGRAPDHVIDDAEQVNPHTMGGAGQEGESVPPAEQTVGQGGSEFDEPQLQDDPSTGFKEPQPAP